MTRGRLEAAGRASTGASAAGIVAVLAGLALAPAPTPGPHAGLRVPYIESFTGKQAPLFTLKDLQGKVVKLSALRGKVVLLNFWYSTCLPCRNETPDLITLHSQHTHDDLVILGINLDDVMIPQMQGRELTKFLMNYPIPYPVLKGDQKIVDAYRGVPVQPISFLLDRAGVVTRVFWGAYPGSIYERAVQPLLAAPAVPAPARSGA